MLFEEMDAFKLCMSKKSVLNLLNLVKENVTETSKDGPVPTVKNREET